MKINIKNIALIAGLFLFGACSNDNENVNPNNEVAFNISISDLATRSTTNFNDFKSTFAAGDKIGIYATTTGTLLSSGNYADNVEYVRQNDGSWMASSPIQYPSSGTITFFAYYPYNAATSDATAIGYTVKDDQNADTAEQSDFMTAINMAGVNDTKSVALTFKHKTALVQLIVKQGTADVDVSTVTVASITNINTSGIIDLASDELSSNSVTGNVVMKLKGSSAEKTVFWAHVPAQTVTANTQFFNTSYNGGDYVHSLSGNTTFEAGTVKSFALKINGNGTQVLSVISLNENTNNWTPNNDNDNDESLAIN